MKNNYTFLLLLIILISGVNLKAQTFEIIPDSTYRLRPLGSEIVFDINIINKSQTGQKYFELRTKNQIPAAWQSSLCFGENCFAPDVDSIASTPDFGSSEIAPGDTLHTSLHVFTSTNDGTALITIKVGNMRDMNDVQVLNFTATTIHSDIKDNSVLESFSLNQNYPNPFNPTTRIQYSIPVSSNVKLTITDVLGNEIKTLVNEFQIIGNHSVDFDGKELKSGVYFCNMVSQSFNKTIKMLLIK